MGKQFNKVCKWTISTILRAASLKDRTKIIGRFIKICMELHKLRNFNSLSATYSAMNSTSIYRLKSAWAGVRPKYKKFFDETLKTLFSNHSNQKNLRNSIKNATTSSVPHMGIMLKDLVFIDDGNFDSKENGMVNFGK